MTLTRCDRNAQWRGTVGRASVQQRLEGGRGRKKGVISLAMTNLEVEELKEMAEIFCGVGREPSKKKGVKTKMLGDIACRQDQHEGASGLRPVSHLQRVRRDDVGFSG